MKNVEKTCKWCSSIFFALAKEVKRGKGNFCGVSCANAARSSARKNPNARKEWIDANRNSLHYIMQRRAHHAVEQEVKMGRMIMCVCNRCGSDTRVHAHHHDYSKPLEIEWLCVSCHRKHHG